MSSLQWLWKNLDRKHRVLWICSMLLGLLTASLFLVNPTLNSLIVDRVIVGGDTSQLIPILLLMLLAKALRMAIRFMKLAFAILAGQNFFAKMRKRLFEKLLSQDMRYFNTHRSGDIMTRLSADTDWCQHFISSLSFQAIENITLFLLSIVYLFFIHWKMALSICVLSPFLFAISKFYSKRIRPMFVSMREKLSVMNAAAKENIAGNRIVKAFAREDFEIDRFTKHSEEYRKANLDINDFWMKFFPLIELIANLVTAIIIFLGGYFIINGEMTAGQLTVFSTLGWTMVGPTRALGTYINDWYRFKASAAKVMEFDFARPRIKDAADAVPHDNVSGLVEFDHVTFKVGRTKIVDDVSFTLRPGKTLAIMGPTGSGKSTILNLLARFYDVSSGEIRVDGCDIRQWKLDELRHAIGMATQEVFLFSDSVYNNISFGAPELSDEEIRSYAVMSDSAEFIVHLEDQYNTLIGERGVGLSGGQKQRLALARALAVNPRILVLDDTTSALDMETEKYIQQQLANLPFECAKIIVAQRVSSVKNADEIIIIQDGKITERGTHDQLLAQKGYYRETYAVQNGLPLDGEEGGDI